MFRCYWALALPLLCASCQDPDRGTGPITLSPSAEASFAEYMGRDAPILFLLTEDGRGSYYTYCVGGFNCTTSAARVRALDACRRRNAGQDCKIYAIGRSIVWQDAEGAAMAVASAAPERARAYEEIGDLSLAEGDYRAVLRIDPDHVAARARLDPLLAPAAAPN
jgi:hypothetical protein